MFLFVTITLKTNILIKHWIYKTGFFRQTANKKKMISRAISKLLPLKQISTPRKTSEIRAKQKEKDEIKL